jgi:phosphoglycolate phosphatase
MQSRPSRSCSGAGASLDGIVFDLDGTLWDTTEGVARAWDAVVRERAPEAGTIDRAAIMRVMGMAHQELSRRLFPALALEAREALVQACYAAEERCLRRDGAQLYPGVAEGLPSLAARVPLAIVSNCQRGYIETFFAVSGLKRWFRDAECHGNTGRGKAENLAAVVRRCGMTRPVYVGDTAGDQQAAADAGTAFVHAAYGFGQPALPCASYASFTALAEHLLARTAASNREGVHMAQMKNSPGSRRSLGMQSEPSVPATPVEPDVKRGCFAAPVDEAAVARNWSRRGFSCQLWVDPPGQEWNDFVHSTRELVTVVAGRLEFALGGRKLELGPGDELLIPSNTRHSVKNVHSGTSRWRFGYDR